MNIIFENLLFLYLSIHIFFGPQVSCIFQLWYRCRKTFFSQVLQALVWCELGDILLLYLWQLYTKLRYLWSTSSLDLSEGRWDASSLGEEMSKYQYCFVTLVDMVIGSWTNFRLFFVVLQLCLLSCLLWGNGRVGEPHKSLEKGQK